MRIIIIVIIIIITIIIVIIINYVSLNIVFNYYLIKLQYIIIIMLVMHFTIKHIKDYLYVVKV